MKRGTAPRVAAAEVIGRVMRKGAWTQQALRSATADFVAIDRKQTEALTYGTIRRLSTIDWQLQHAAGRDLSKVDASVLDALRVGAFEVLFGRAPTPVVVSTAVEAVRQINPRASGFANAVLRQINRTEPPSITAEFERSLELALPEWLIGSLDRVWGTEETDAFARASLEDAPLVVRQRPHFQPVVGHPLSGIPSAFEVDAGNVGDHPRQDPSSIVVGLIVDAETSQRVVDVAAAPGGKTLHLLDQVGPSGQVVALDSHGRRLQKARKRVPQAMWIQADGTRPPLRHGQFDRVLVDAPCSGLGTLRRRPEIRHRITTDDVTKLADIQSGLVAAGLKLLQPDGFLVYSVCTVTPEETVGVIERFDSRPPTGFPGRRWGRGWLLGPHLTGSDGMFISIVRS